MKNEIKIFFTALMFFTRIPCPAWVGHSEARLESATRYFPFVGWIVAGIVLLVYYLSSLILPTSPAIVFSMVAGVLVTGAFHEDGLADVCDGFGGGWTKEKILEIMKDSRIGTYGVVGLVFVLLTKYLLSDAICQASSTYFMLSVWLAHSLSRLAAVNMIMNYPYARADATSKVKPLAKRLGSTDFVIAFFIGMIPLLIVVYIYGMLWLLVPVPLVAIVWRLGQYFKKWIGGFTGDCLGTTQQVSEIAIYIMMLLLWKYI